MRVDSAARTHAGRVRTQNEDAFVNKADTGVFAVIDGMGGQEAGEVAAAIAAEELGQVPGTTGVAGETLLARALRDARTRILAEAKAHPEWAGMGAVATAIRLDDDGRTVAVAHVGDTRAWLVGAGGVRQLTTDHVGAAEGGQKPRVARDLGRAEMAEPWVETHRVRVSAGDLVVLATDGLHDVLPVDELTTELARLRREGKDADAVATRLVALPLGRGAPDNVTVVAVRIGSWQRRGRSRSMAWVAVASVFAIVALLGVLAWLLVPRVRATPTALPEHVAASERVELWPVAPLDLAAGAHTTVDGALLVYGAELRGHDWALTTAHGLTTVDSARVELDGAWTIDLGEAGALVLADTQVHAAGLRITGGADARLVLEDVTVYTDGPVELPGGRQPKDGELVVVPPAPRAP